MAEQKKRVLVGDDNEEVALTLKRLIEGKGFLTFCIHQKGEKTICSPNLVSKLLNILPIYCYNNMMIQNKKIDKTRLTELRNLITYSCLVRSVTNQKDDPLITERKQK